MVLISPFRLSGAAAVFALSLVATGSTAKAADVDEGYPPRDNPGYGRYERTPYPSEAYEPRFARPPADVPEGRCRIRHEREVDNYGRELVRRFRVCDEGVVAVQPRYGRNAYPDRPYDEPVPRAWRRPPANVDPGYDDDQD